MSCCECSKKVHARGLCRRHYWAWYRLHRDEVKRVSIPMRKHRYWKFTAKHWWKWWEKRAPDLKTFELRAGIKAMRHGLR